jgi:hypothetical protein
MNNKDFSSIYVARHDAATAAGPSRLLIEKRPEAPVNVPPAVRSNVVALLVPDGHHPYLSWVASATRAP